MFLGVDIGGTKTAVCLGDRQGNILEKIKFSTGGPEKTVEDIIAAGLGGCACHGYFEKGL